VSHLRHTVYLQARPRETGASAGVLSTPIRSRREHPDTERAFNLEQTKETSREMVMLEASAAGSRRPYDVQKIDDHTWIVRDRVLDRSDPRSVIACISSHQEGDVEVLWMHAPQFPQRYSSLAAALGDARRVRRAKNNDRRPPSSPRFPPMPSARQ
jgi:hypothetical protein